MKQLAAEVEKNEPGCLSYGVFVGKDGVVSAVER